jgi:hypothetical protein
VLLVTQVYKVPLELRVRQVHKAQLEPLVILEFKELQELKEQQVFKVQQVPRVLPDYKVRPDFRAFKVSKDH